MAVFFFPSCTNARLKQADTGFKVFISVTSGCEVYAASSLLLNQGGSTDTHTFTHTHSHTKARAGMELK